jgi:hypothetical protein
LTRALEGIASPVLISLTVTGSVRRGYRLSLSSHFSSESINALMADA